MNCPVCRAEVGVEVGRPTVPADWQYRYQAHLMHYYQPGTHDEHRCRLTPQRFQMAAEPQLYEDPVQLPTPSPTPRMEAVESVSGDGYVDASA